MSTPAVPEHLRNIADVAVDEFLAQEVSLEILGHGQSLAWRVDAPSGTFLLRVHSPLCPPARPEFFTVQAIESECTWLRALGEETDLVVQKPMPSPTGGYVLSVPNSAVDDAVPCTLLTWVEGEHLDGKRTEEQAARLGELLATLQAHSRNWVPPAGFERPIHDRASWRLALTRAEELVTIGIASNEDLALITRTVDLAEDELTSLASLPDRIGLIHADLHGDNYVFHNDSPRPIDFGLAGFGPWLWDVAECVGHLGPQRRRDFVDAYAKRWPLEDGDQRRIEGYLCASLVEVLGNNAPDPREQEFLTRAVPAFLAFFRHYTEGTPFLFGV